MYTNLCGARIFTTMDLRSGYYHIGLDKESKEKLLLLLFSVNMNIMQSHLDKHKKEHLKHTEIIFQKLKAAGLKLKESKEKYTT